MRHLLFKPAFFIIFILPAALSSQLGDSSLFRARPGTAQETKPLTLRGEAALDQLKHEGQYESLNAAMSQARFSVSRTAQTPLGRVAWHAPNPAAGYHAYVTEAGVSIAVNDESYVSLSLDSLGYGESLQAVAPGKVSGDKQTIDITRVGGLREWYVNGPDGLEHGFTLAEPPAGARQKGAPLRLAMQVSAGWSAAASDDGKLVTLRGAHGQAVEYGKLVVRDNLGRTIPAQLTVADEQVVIEVEDSDAAYPLTIDPLFTLQQKLTAADGAANDYLGYSVALSGNTALVGAPYDDVNGMEQGSAYVFVRSFTPSGATWTLQQKLTAQDGTSFDYFGYSVALDGNTALVGALYGPGSLHPEQGAVYVFVRGGTTWFQQAKLNANENTHGAQFGAALALDGNTAVIGAPTYTITPSYADIGAVFIFTRSGATQPVWTQQARLNANDGEDGDYFGVTVAVDGDTALIGAPNNAITAGGQGAAYIFTRSGATQPVWIQRQRLLAVQGAADDHFGVAVALSGEQALIGAYMEGTDDRGSVYSFERSATGWAQTSKFRAHNLAVGAHFGVSVAMSGDTAVVGASLGLYTPGVDQRSAYMFLQLGEWTQVSQFGPELGAADDRFGYAVALDGDTALVGAYRSDGAAVDQGAAYAFVLHDSRHVEQQRLVAQDGATIDFFGASVSLSGDTLAVGSDRDDIGENRDQGSVYVFTRNGAVWTFQQKLTANDGGGDDNFGAAVALSGDTLVVGAYLDDIGGNADQGSAYIFTRTGTVWTQQQKLMAIAIDGLPNDRFGSSVAISGQTVAVGASYVDNKRGAAYVFTRNGAVWTQQQKFYANDGAANEYFGSAVALSGDTLVVGAPFDTIGAKSFQGSAYVFTRSGATQPVWTQLTKLMANDGAIDDRFGGAVALSGDTLVVGAHQANIGGNADQGSAYVFARTGTAWVQAQKLTADDGAAGDRFGDSVAIGNGVLVVGASWDDVGANEQQGSAYVFANFGYWYQQQKLTAGDGETNDYFGDTVALSGDVVVVGAKSKEINYSNQGAAYVFASPACPAITIAPTSLPNGAVGAAYDQPLMESGGGVGEYLLSVSSGSLPPGLMVSFAPGKLSGTPTTPGTYRFTITATFIRSGCSGSREYTLTVTSSLCPTITVNPASLPAGQGGEAYSQQLSAGGGAAPYRFTVAAGALPDGMSLSGTGLLSGAPRASGSFNFTVQATDANGCQNERRYTLTIDSGTGGATGLQYYPLPHPIRLLDTRPGARGCNTPGAPISDREALTLQARAACDGVTIPDEAQAVVGNATVVNFISGGGFITLFPNGAPQPTVSNLNYQSNQVIANAFTVGLGDDGGFNAFASSLTHLIVDITGYYAPPGAAGSGGLFYHPLPSPMRLLDTRAGAAACATPGDPLQGGASLTQNARVSCNGMTIPANAQAVVGNATAVNFRSGAGFITLWPTGATQPAVSNLNYQSNQILPNAFTVGLGGGGGFEIFASSTTDLIIDVTGYYSNEAVDVNGAGLLYHPLPSPIRLLDTRPGQPACDQPAAPLQGGAARTQQARVSCDGATIPANAQAVVGNATVINFLSGGGFITLWPNGAAQPAVSNLNYTSNQIIPNAFTVGLGANGEFKIFASAATHFIADVTGYFAP